MQRNVEQPALSARHHGRHAGNLARCGTRLLDEQQPSPSLGDEKTSVGQPRHGPRMVESVGHGLDAEAVSG